MNPQVEMPHSSQTSRVQRWLASPRLMEASMPTEIIPQGLASLELKLAGWGWVRLEGTGNPEPRRWFWHDQELILFVPVGTHPILTLGNLWGTHRYQIDATAGREEVWVPHNTRFLFRLPDAASTNLPSAPQDLPTTHWRAAGINAPGSGHWRVHMPTDRSVRLPDHSYPLALPGLKLDDWRASAPMDELDRRIQRAASTD